MTSVIRLVDCAEAAAPVPELEAVAGRSLAAVQGTRVLHRNVIQSTSKWMIITLPLKYE